MSELENLSVKELKRILAEAEIIAKSMLNKLRPLAQKIAEQLGVQLGNHYTKYDYQDSEIRVFFDSYVGYVSVSVSGVTVMSNHPADIVFRAGSWINHLERLAAKVDDEEAEKKKLLLLKLENFMPLEDGY